MAGPILDKKMVNVPKEADCIAMGNPGCMMQMSVGVLKTGTEQEIIHTVALLDRAYLAETEPATQSLFVPDKSERRAGA
jgi:glycolate oxidase iron-sulfur subunit